MTTEFVTTHNDGQLRPQRRQVLVDGVHDTLMAMLMSGAPGPGDPVSIDALARDLDVSPTPIREALARIESSGLVVREPLRGYRVAPLMSSAELRQLMEARLLIEPHNAAAACANRSDGLIEELAKALVEMREAPTGPTYREYRLFLIADASFHQIISRYAGNHFLAEALERLGAHQHRFRFFGNTGVTDAPFAIEEHEAVLVAIREGSINNARNAMKRHIQNVLARASREQQMAVSRSGEGPAATSERLVTPDRRGAYS